MSNRVACAICLYLPSDQRPPIDEEGIITIMNGTSVCYAHMGLVASSTAVLGAEMATRQNLKEKVSPELSNSDKLPS